jgi:hypothetical protein
VEPIHFGADIKPAFFRLSAAWKGKPQERVLERELQDIRLAPSPVRLLYRQPAFVAQHGRGMVASVCPQAERQAKKRFCLLHQALPEEVQSFLDGTCH